MIVPTMVSVLILVVQIAQDLLNVIVSQDGQEKIALNLIVQTIVVDMECVFLHHIVFVHLDGLELLVILNYVKMIVINLEFV